MEQLFTPGKQGNGSSNSFGLNWCQHWANKKFQCWRALVRIMKEISLKKNVYSQRFESLPFNHV